MHKFPPPPAGGSLPEPLAVIVTGAHPAAEYFDRPIAYKLREIMAGRLLAGDITQARAKVWLCSDLWYLNQDQLRALPTVCIGGPTVNALAAYLADRLPSVFAVDNVMMVQMDFSDGIPVASCWGVDHGATAAAVEHFEQRWLGEFLEAVPA